MWFHNILFGFTPSDAPLVAMGMFRIFVGIAIFLKAIRELIRGYQRYYREGSYFRFRYLGKSKLKKIMGFIHRSTLLLRLPLSIFLTGGFGARWAALLLAVSFAAELRVYFKYHVNLLFFMMTIMAAYPEFGLSFHVTDFFNNSSLTVQQWLYNSTLLQGNIMGQLFIIALVVIVYISAAARKISRQFLSGNLIRESFIYLFQEKQYRKHRDFFSQKLTDFCLHFFQRHSWMYAFFAVSTMLFEFLIPILLLGRTPMIFMGTIFGIIMHLMFLIVDSYTLLHFSFFMIGTYILFFPPTELAFFIQHLLLP